MHHTILKLMIVNWNWDVELAYPNFVPKKHEKPESCSLSCKLTWIPAVKPENIQEDHIGVKLKKRTQTHTYVAPTKVQLNELLDTSKLPCLRRNYLRQILEAIAKQFPDQKQIEILFLFHRQDGFDEGREIGQMMNSLIASIDGANQWQIKAGFFGGATGVMYESRGFLSPRYYNFRHKKKVKVGWFKSDPKRIQFLDEKHFRAVWEEYWYQTPLRLLDYRHLMNQMLIPERGESVKPKAKRYTKNLLHHLHAREDRQYEQLEQESWDFSECVDLNEWLTAKNKKFPSHQAWLGDLKKFIREEDTDFSNMKKGFNELTDSFHS